VWEPVGTLAFLTDERVIAGRRTRCALITAGCIQDGNPGLQHYKMMPGSAAVNNLTYANEDFLPTEEHEVAVQAVTLRILFKKVKT